MDMDNEAEGNASSPYADVDAKLRALASSMVSRPAWYGALLSLKPDSPANKRLAVYRSIREAGSLPYAVTFHLVSYLIDEIATANADDKLETYETRLRAIEEAYRLQEGGIWTAGSAPSGYTELRDEYYRAWDEHFAATLEEFQEHEIARLLRHDRGRFEMLDEEGRRYFQLDTELDMQPSVWIRKLVEGVANCMTADSGMGPLGYRYREDEGFWEIDVYPTPVELIGGAVDGEIVAPGFTLAIDELKSAFDRVDELNWHSLGFPGDDGPRIVLEGDFQGHDVLLQVLAYAPEDEQPGMKFDTVPRNP